MQNPSGIKPKDYQVLIKDDEVEERTAGGIILPTQAKDDEKFAAQRGTIIATSPLAFNHDTYPDGEQPKAGDRVFYNKYAGQVLKGLDGQEYRLCEDRSIKAVLESEAA